MKTILSLILALSLQLFSPSSVAGGNFDITAVIPFGMVAPLFAPAPPPPVYYPPQPVYIDPYYPPLGYPGGRYYDPYPYYRPAPYGYGHHHHHHHHDRDD